MGIIKGVHVTEELKKALITSMKGQNSPYLAIQQVKPHEIYHFATPSHIAVPAGARGALIKRQGALNLAYQLSIGDVG